MPEYLTPGVYVEETSFRSRSIEGVPTSTFGMAGRTEYGPVPYYSRTGVDDGAGPALVTSFTEFERAFGGLEIGDETNYLAFAARAFFANGGRRLYVARVLDFTWTAPTRRPSTRRELRQLAVPAGAAALLRWRARWPGSVAERFASRSSFRRSKNILIGGGLKGVPPGAARRGRRGRGRTHPRRHRPGRGQRPGRDAAPRTTDLGLRGPGGGFEAVARLDRCSTSPWL